MTFYEVILFLHIAAAVMWVGAGMLLFVLGLRADRARDDATIVQVLGYAGSLANIYFIPASLATFAFGLIMTIDAWAFDQLWIILGLIGYLATFFTGAVLIGPRAEKLGAEMAERGVGPAQIVEGRKILTIARIDYVVLFLVIFDMAVKPTGDDVGTLIFMAAVLAAGIALTTSRYRNLEAARPEPATAT